MIAFCESNNQIVEFMHKIIIHIFFALTILQFSSAHASTLDAPHNESNGIGCSSCHTYSTWWQYSPSDTSTPAYSVRVNNICLSCHDDTASGPVMQAHDSNILGEKHGVWSQNCIDCHDPHNQPQLTTWLQDNASELFLVTGLMDTIDNGDGSFSYSYIANGDNTTTIDIDSNATQATNFPWDDPANWNKKNDNPVFNRGLIFVHSTSDAYNTYSVVNATNSTITIKGLFDPAGVAPNQDATFGLIYGQLIKSGIMAATVVDPATKSKKDVKFFDPTLLNTLGGFTDQETPRTGICQVCHLNTDFWTEDGLNDGHNADRTCTECHLRDESFKKPAGGHVNGDGTFDWTAACAACHDPAGSAEIINDIHKVGSSNSCTLCHQSESGGSLAPATSAGNTTVGNMPHSCTDCHIDSIGQHHATANAQWGDCTWCHADPRQQWEIDFGVLGTKPRQLACRQCHIEATGTGLTVYKLDYPVTTSETMTFPFGDLGQPANNSKTVVKTVMDGTNGTTNHSVSGPVKIDVFNFGACLSCHDGTTATAVNIWHARPKYSEIPTDSDTDVVRMHYDVLRYAPGRSIFNLWRGDGLQGEPYFSHDEGFYDTSGAAKIRGNDFFGSQNRRNIPWNDGSTSSPFTMTQVPCFNNAGLGNDTEGLCGENSAAAFDMVPVFDDGPTLDNIQVIQAAYDGSDLLISATNSNGALSITYDGTDHGPMTSIATDTWVKSISLPNLSVSTVDIITTNTLGTNILAYPICNEDQVVFVGATWTATATNQGTLSVTATNSQGASGQLLIDYDNTTVPLAYTAGQWSVDITQVPYQSTVDIFSQCGSSLENPVTDLSDNLQVTSAAWDGTNLIIAATNTFAGATIWADYAGVTDIPLIESPANTWTLTSAQPLYSTTVRIWSDTSADITVAVENTSPGTYPPDCDSADNRDKIFTPLDKSRYDPNDLDELHVDAINQINTSYGAQLYLTYSETNDGNTRYNLLWNKPSEFELKANGFTWTPGATVTVWSEDSGTNVMAIACNQPVFNRSLSDSVTILQAKWTPDNGGTLNVMAENTNQNNLAAYLDYDDLIATPMVWNATHQHWHLTLTGVAYHQTVRVYSDGNGDSSAAVADLTPDPITVDQAAWRNANGSDILVVRATNTLAGETSIFANYNGITDIPLTWNYIDEIWELSLSQMGYASTIRIWSVRPGESTVVVDDMSNSHLNLSFTQECAQCHLDDDITFDIHRAICATCHSSTDPVVQDAINTGNGGSCTTCHIPASGRFIVSEIDFSEETFTIPLWDHNRPDSDLRVPIPEYLWDTRSEPFAVAKDTPIILSARFQTQSAITSAVINSPLFGSQTITFTNGVSGFYNFTLPASYSSTPGVKQIDIAWQYCDENGTSLPDCQSPEPMHISSHTLYVTHAYPAGQAPYYAKLIELSAQWSQDATTEQEIVDAVFDGTAILGGYGYSYVYPFLGRTMNSVADILRQKEGACGEWSAFLLRAIELHGIDVYKVDIVPTSWDEYIVEIPAMGTTQDLWFYGDHAFVIYGADISEVNDPYAGTAYDSSFNLTGPGWGGYEDVLFPYFEDNAVWIANPGYGNGPGDDVNNSHVLQYSDDHIYVEQ